MLSNSNYRMGKAVIFQPSLSDSHRLRGPFICRKTTGIILPEDMPIWNIMHPTSYIPDLAPSPSPLFDHLNDDFRNLFDKADANVRCIVRKTESASFQTALRHILEHDVYPGERGLSWETQDVKVIYCFLANVESSLRL